MRRRRSNVFSGPLRSEFDAFAAYRQSLGTCHGHVWVVLRHLDDFLEQEASVTRDLTQQLLNEWMTRLADRAAITRRNYFRVARQFCVFRARADPAGFIPDAASCPRVTTRFRPYIYSDQEIRALIKAATMLSGELRPHTYATLLLLLYTTGVRIGEAIRLQLRDLDRGRAVLHVRAGKFGKSRLVPITTSVMARLELYLERRRQVNANTDPEAPLFWNLRRGPYSLIGVQQGISQLIRAVCEKRPGTGTWPRVHDVRHTFAVHRLLRWYREGADVQAKLPLLATYLGHHSFLSTQFYLTATPELLAEASRRFHHSFGSLIHVQEEPYDNE